MAFPGFLLIYNEVERFLIPIPQSQSVKVQYFRPAVDHQQWGQTEKYFEIQTFALARLHKLEVSQPGTRASLLCQNDFIPCLYDHVYITI